jgi:hypothetical protein
VNPINPYVGAYWGPRREPLAACADRATRFLAGLCSCSPVLATWFEKGDSREDALRRRVLPERDIVMGLLGSGRNQRDIDRSVIEDLGYSLDVWNGQEPAVGLRIACGKYPPTPNIKNAVVINLPYSEEGLGDLASPEMAKRLVGLAVECWGPDWATWSSHQWREEQGRPARQPVLGWVTYLRGMDGPRALPPGVSLEPFGDGALVTSGDDIADVTGAKLAALRESLADDLERAST